MIFNNTKSKQTQTQWFKSMCHFVLVYNFLILFKQHNFNHCTILMHTNKPSSLFRKKKSSSGACKSHKISLTNSSYIVSHHLKDSLKHNEPRYKIHYTS